MANTYAPPLPINVKQAMAFHRQDFAEQLNGWCLKKSKSSPFVSKQLKNVLLRAYDDIINAVIFEQTNTIDADERTRGRAQAAAATQAIEHVMNHPQLMETYPSQPELRKVVARELVGSVISRAIQTSKSMGYKLDMPISLFL